MKPGKFKRTILWTETSRFFPLPAKVILQIRRASSIHFRRRIIVVINFKTLNSAANSVLYKFAASFTKFNDFETTPPLFFFGTTLFKILIKVRLCQWCSVLWQTRPRPHAYVFSVAFYTLKPRLQPAFVLTDSEAVAVQAIARFSYCADRQYRMLSSFRTISLATNSIWWFAKAFTRGRWWCRVQSPTVISSGPLIAPIADECSAFDFIASNSQDEGAVVLKRFQDAIYIGQPTRRANRCAHCAALFSSNTWNLHDHVVNDLLPRNNPGEGWHQAFQRGKPVFIRKCYSAGASKSALHS